MLTKRNIIAAALMAAFAIITPTETAMADEQVYAAEDNRAIVTLAFDNWARGEGNLYTDLLAPDVVWTITGHSLASRTYPSQEAFLAEVIGPFGQRMSRPLVPVIRSMVAEGDRVVIHFDAEGVARDGVPYRNTYAWFFRMRGGKVVEATAFFDAIAFDELWTRVEVSNPN